MTYNVFVLGLDDLGTSELATLPDANDYTFHQLLNIDELQSGTWLRHNSNWIPLTARSTRSLATGIFRSA